MNGVERLSCRPVADVSQEYQTRGVNEDNGRYPCHDADNAVSGFLVRSEDDGEGEEENKVERRAFSYERHSESVDSQQRVIIGSREANK